MADVFNLGDTVKLAALFTDEDDVAVDPTSILLSIRKPSGVETVYTYGVDIDLVKNAVGSYSLTLVADEHGIWWYKFEGLATGQTSQESYFEVNRSVFE